MNNSQTKYLNALLDHVAKKIRLNNAWIWTYKKIFSNLSSYNKSSLDLNDDVFDKSKKLVISVDTYVEVHFIDFRYPELVIKILDLPFLI